MKYNENVNEKVDLAQVHLENGYDFLYGSTAPIREYHESQAKEFGNTLKKFETQ